MVFRLQQFFRYVLEGCKLLMNKLLITYGSIEFFLNAQIVSDDFLAFESFCRLNLTDNFLYNCVNRQFSLDIEIVLGNLYW